MAKTFYSYSFGCRVNQAEKEALDSALLKHGFSFQKDKPDLYIINTCAVTAKAEKEVRQLIHKVKKELPGSFLIVTGCAVTNWLKTKASILKNIDLPVDNINKELLAKMIKSQFFHFFHSGGGMTAPQGGNDLLNSKYLKSKRAIIKTQDGCNRFCTYCIVPFLRGKPKSNNLVTIVTKIKKVEKKINEVILTAINTEAYGMDTNENLIGLIDDILRKTQIKRISFGSINPWSITPEFIRYYSKIYQLPRFVDYFHIPIQSGSNKILDLMKRGYTREELREKFESLYKIYPFIYFGTDIISGFLDESDQDFQDTYKFLEDSPITKFHVFRYSLRKNTAAYYLAKRLKEPSDKVKKARAEALIKLGQKKLETFKRKHMGKEFQAMIIKKMGNGLYQALLDNQMPVIIKSAKQLSYEFKNVKIKELRNSDLIAETI